jgi:SAM-dependent methyltransferase
MTTKGKGRKRRNARNSDRHVLYQESVQAPETDSRFLSRYFKRMTGQPLRRFREDFCGTATLSCHVVQLHRSNRALGVDLDGPTLAWARHHNLSQLDEDQRCRVQLVRGDVLDVRRPRVQMIAAMNFSYFVFKTRETLGAYLANGLRSLEPGGLLLLDVWGGSETQVEQEERRRIDGFTYVWDQHSFDPLTYHTECRIHFEFPDHSRIRDAFVYDWRLWTIPELRELMLEAGFTGVQILWEATDRETGEGNGVFRKVTRGDADDAWIAYIVGQRPSRS